MSTFVDNFTPRDFYELSIDIESSVLSTTNISINGRDSAWLRNAISRAYYAVYLSLRQEFLNKSTLNSLITGFGRDHNNIKLKLYDLPPNLIYLANFFENLRDDRNNADYDMPPDYNVNPTKVQTANLKALDILNNIPNIMQNL